MKRVPAVKVPVKSPEDSRYIIKSLVHASQVLATFESSKHVLGLRDVVALTGLKKGMCFRLLHTLHRCGFLEKVGQAQFRTTSSFRPRRRFRIGYAGQGQDTSFPKEVRGSTGTEWSAWRSTCWREDRCLLLSS